MEKKEEAENRKYKLKKVGSFLEIKNESAMVSGWRSLLQVTYVQQDKDQASPRNKARQAIRRIIIST